MKELAANGIMTGTVFMPILPFIYDGERNVESVVRRTRECGGQYVLDGGLTLWGYSKTHFYQVLRAHRPDLVPKYDGLYGNQKAFAEHAGQVHQRVLACCRKHKLTPYISRPVDFYPEELQVNKRIAATFYLKAREMQLSGKRSYREWTYRKAAWTLDDMKESVERIYQKRGIAGILEIKGIGRSLAKQIEELLKGRTAS